MTWKAAGTAGLFVFAASLPLSIAAANIGWGVCLLALLADAEARSGLWRRCAGDPLLKPWLVFLSAAALACLFGVDPLNGLPMLRTDFGKALVYFVIAAAVVAFDAAPATLGYLLSAAAASGWGIYQAGWTRFPYAHGSVHHVTYGELIALALVLCFSRLAFASRWKEKLLSSPVLALLSAALALSHARGAWLGALAALAVCFAAYAPGRRRIASLAAIYLALGIGVFLAGKRFPLTASLSERAATIFSSSFRSNEIRLISWKVGLHIFKDHPLFGVGPRNVRKVFHDYYQEPIEGQLDWSNLHNLYVHQLAERGAVGLAALLYLFGAFWLFAWRRFRERPDAFRLWAVAGLGAFFIMNFTETSFQHEIDAYSVAWLLALALGKPFEPA